MCQGRAVVRRRTAANVRSSEQATCHHVPDRGAAFCWTLTTKATLVRLRRQWTIEHGTFRVRDVTRNKDRMYGRESGSAPLSGAPASSRRHAAFTRQRSSGATRIRAISAIAAGLRGDPPAITWRLSRPASYQRHRRRIAR